MHEKTRFKKIMRKYTVRRGRLENEARREAAEDRQRMRDFRGDAGQLDRLERNGHGHCKEATRLREKIGAEKADS